MTIKSGNIASKLRAVSNKVSPLLVDEVEEEKRALMADIKDVYAEAKAIGFEPKIMRQVIRLRAMDRDLLSEQDALLDTYRDALGLR